MNIKACLYKYLSFEGLVLEREYISWHEKEKHICSKSFIPDLQIVLFSVGHLELNVGQGQESGEKYKRGDEGRVDMEQVAHEVLGHMQTIKAPVTSQATRTKSLPLIGTYLNCKGIGNYLKVFKYNMKTNWWVYQLTWQSVNKAIFLSL